MGYVLETYKVMYDEKTIGYYHVCNAIILSGLREMPHMPAAGMLMEFSIRR